MNTILEIALSFPWFINTEKPNSRKGLKFLQVTVVVDVSVFPLG